MERVDVHQHHDDVYKMYTEMFITMPIKKEITSTVSYCTWRTNGFFLLLSCT